MTSVAPTATPPTTATAAASTSTGNSTADAINKLSGDFNNFLTLLTTQLKNQDPLSPMDSTQFTQQLVAFTGVEQQINTNTKLDTLIGLNKTDLLTQSASFIGNQIQANGTQVWLPADGSGAQIGYTLPSDASTAAMAISDANGNIIRTGAVPVTQGDHVVGWDGTNDQGTAQPSGVYNVTIQALDQNSQPVNNITTSIIGTVTNVSSDQTNGTVLSIGSVQVPLSSVTSIKKPS
jgi:flagellar basal-body rod modification protein FlgD